MGDRYGIWFGRMGTFFKFEMMTFYLSGTLGWWCWWDKILLTSGDIYNPSHTMGVFDVFMLYLLYQLLNHPSTVCINKHIGGINFVLLVVSNVRTNIAPHFSGNFRCIFAVSFRELSTFKTQKRGAHPMNPGVGNHIPHYVFAATQLGLCLGPRIAEASSFAAGHLQHGERFTSHVLLGQWWIDGEMEWKIPSQAHL